MRLFTSTIATMAMIFSAATAGAVEFSLVGPSTINLTAGDIGTTIQLSINIANASASSVTAVGASVYGYNQSVVSFVSGRATASIFNAICVGLGTCFGGLGQANNAFFSPAALVQSVVGGLPRVQIVNAANTTPTSQTGAGDQGYDGTTSTPDIIVSFRVVGIGSTTLRIGTGFQGDGVVFGDASLGQTQPVDLVVNVVPEPGTALLMGLGLAGLGAAGRRRE